MDKEKEITLDTLENIIFDILNANDRAKKDDYFLYLMVTNKINPNLSRLSFFNVMYNHNELGLPNWDSVTRIRRKLQSKYPELVDTKAKIARRKSMKRYISYVKGG